MNSIPSWREKRLLTEDDNLHPFYWTYGTGELIDELPRIDEILNLKSYNIPLACQIILE
jgi:hypothetical protein